MRDSSLHPIRPLNLDDAFSGRELLVVGCTGFLGKVMLAMLLERLPTVRKIHVVLRVPGGVAPEHRLWRGVLDSGAFASLRASLGRDFEPVLRDKLVALAGDVARPLIGLSPAEVAGMRGRLSAIVNVAGIVDFDPPLDLALEVNAHGVRHLVELSHQLGGVPLLHTSTCFVAGDRQGFVEERDPRLEPFARGALAGVGGDWSPEEELRSCQRLIEAERVRLDEGHHRDDIERDAREALVGEGTLFSPRALEAARARARRKLARRLLVAAGMRRARALGFPNTYTYTKALGEQLIARSGVPFAIVRPAIVESCERYPSRGWNEGSNTSAPLIYLLREGALQIPGSDHALDVIPCDHVAAGTLLALAELLDGTAAPVYQLGTSDSNRCSMRRFFELSGLYKRRYYRAGGGRGPSWLRGLQAHWEGVMVQRRTYEHWGPPALALWSRRLARLLQWAGQRSPAQGLQPWASQVLAFSRRQQRLARVLGAFVPFTAEYDYVFSSERVRAARARLSAADAARLPWAPEQLDWAGWFFGAHAAGLEQWVFPELEAKLRRGPRPGEVAPLLMGLSKAAQAGAELPALVLADQGASETLAPGPWLGRIRCCAARLAQAGVQPGAAVSLGELRGPELAIIVPALWAVAAHPSLGASPSNSQWAIVQDSAAASAPSPAEQGRAPAPVSARRLALPSLLTAGSEREPAAVSPEAVAVQWNGESGASHCLTFGALHALSGALLAQFPLNAGDTLELPRTSTTLSSLLWLLLSVERRCRLRGAEGLASHASGVFSHESAAHVPGTLSAASRAASDARPWEWAVLLSGVVQPGLGLVSTGEGGGIATVPGGATRVWSPRDPVASRPSVVPAAG